MCPISHRGELLLFNIISYNLRENRAIGELLELTQRFSVDMLCLQECDTTTLPDTVGGLRLADSTKRNRLGLAIYYRSDRFTAEETRAFALKKSLHDHLMAPAHERLIGTRMVDTSNGQSLVVASFHAAPLTASNSLRRKQINSAHTELGSIGAGLPMVMVGDFNYPFFRKNLTSRVRDTGYEVTASDTSTYARYKFFNGHFDFATSYNLNIGGVRTLPAGGSDHMPILVSASYNLAQAA